MALLGAPGRPPPLGERAEAEFWDAIGELGSDRTMRISAKVMDTFFRISYDQQENPCTGDGIIKIFESTIEIDRIILPGPEGAKMP